MVIDLMSCLTEITFLVTLRIWCGTDISKNNAISGIVRILAGGLLLMTLRTVW